MRCTPTRTRRCFEFYPAAVLLHKTILCVQRVLSVSNDMAYCRAWVIPLNRSCGGLFTDSRLCLSQELQLCSVGLIIVVVCTLLYACTLDAGAYRQCDMCCIHLEPSARLLCNVD